MSKGPSRSYSKSLLVSNEIVEALLRVVSVNLNILRSNMLTLDFFFFLKMRQGISCVNYNIESLYQMV